MPYLSPQKQISPGRKPLTFFPFLATLFERGHHLQPLKKLAKAPGSTHPETLVHARPLASSGRPVQQRSAVRKVCPIRLLSYACCMHFTQRFLVFRTNGNDAPSCCCCLPAAVLCPLSRFACLTDSNMPASLHRGTRLPRRTDF